MLVGYFDSIPRELDEAAQVDGCGPIGALLRVIVPTARPRHRRGRRLRVHDRLGRGAVRLGDDQREAPGPSPSACRSYATQNDVYWNQVMAASLVVSVPVVVGFLLLQRYLVAGLTAGAVK